LKIKNIEINCQTVKNFSANPLAFKQRERYNSPSFSNMLILIGDAGWSSPVARQAHNLKVVGSNPTPATNITNDYGHSSEWLFCYGATAVLLSGFVFQS
jgi:hypothetical protein